MPDPLAGLADVVAPAPVSWLPQTWGWALLAVVLIVLGAWGVMRWRRHRAANRYRVEALAALAALDAQFESAASRAQAVAEIPPLLKRTALAAWPRTDVASLTGPAWLAFLRQHSGGDPLSGPAERLVADAEYRRQDARAAMSADEARLCAAAARKWIKGHRVSA
jgi:hypothetical protein